MKKILLMLALIGSTLMIKAADQPSFPGGKEAMEKYIAAQTKYPEIARENGVEGIVMVGFIVMPDGSLQQLKVLKSIDPDLEKEALRVVSGMPYWIPADKDGTPIEAPSQVSVPFLLE